MSEQQAKAPGKPGRYQRTTGGLIGSLLVTVVGVGAVLAFMGFFRNETEIEPEAVDYLESVEAAQQSGLAPVYPSSLPEGWFATGVDIVPGDRPVFMIRLLTDDGRFAAVRSEDTSPLALLGAWVDEETRPADGYRVPASVADPVATDWDGYTDEGGDTAYVAEREDDTLIVFGSAPAEDLQTLIDVLSTASLS